MTDANEHTVMLPTSLEIDRTLIRHSVSLLKIVFICNLSGMKEAYVNQTAHPLSADNGPAFTSHTTERTFKDCDPFIVRDPFSTGNFLWNLPLKMSHRYRLYLLAIYWILGT